MESRVVPHRIGKLFDVLTEQGEDMRFRIGLARLGEDEAYDNHHAHHKDVDGYGAVVTMFRARGVAFEAPTGRAEPPPPLGRRFAAMARVMRAKPGPAVEWTTRGVSATAPADACRLLTEAQTNRLKEASRRQGVAMTALLLQTLNATVTPLVSRATAAATWTVPVNMRGGVRVESETANASSLVNIEVPLAASSRQVEGILRAAMQENLHWGKWDQVNLMVRFGERTLRKKVKQYYAGGRASRVGVFSNVGAWKADLPGDVGIVGYGPATRMDPLFVGTITVNGKLCLSMRAHALLGATSEDVKGWLGAWFEALQLASATEKVASQRDVTA
jgi:hypothetical protein